MIFTPIFSLSHFPHLRNIKTKRLRYLIRALTLVKKRRKDILSAHPIIGSNEFINIFIIKYPDSNVNEPNHLIHFSLPYLIL